MRRPRIERELLAVELPLMKMLLDGHHEVRRQVCIEEGRIDLFDETTSEIIECKARGTASALLAAATQLRRYRHAFPDPQLAIAVPFVDPEALWFADLLRGAGFRIIEVERDGTGV